MKLPSRLVIAVENVVMSAFIAVSLGFMRLELIGLVASLFW